MAQKKNVKAKARQSKAAASTSRKAVKRAAETKRPAARAAVKKDAGKKPAPRKGAEAAAKSAANARASKPAAKSAAPAKAAAAKSATPKAAAAKANHRAAAKSPAKKPAVAVKAPPAKPAAPAKVASPVAAAAVARATAPATAARAVPAAVARPAAQKITQPMTPKAIAEKAAVSRELVAQQKKPVNQRHGFKTNEFIVYPAHGVGRIVGIEEQEIAGMALELFVITFDKEKLTLRVPTGKLASVGMRKLADEDIVKKAMEILKGRARIKRTMWSRRAQEYVAKINSGDLVSIAEVVRDLYRSEAQPEQSYSERQLYEDALDRMAREIAAVEKLDERGAVQRITDVLSKSAKGRRLAAEEAEAEAEAEVKAA